MRKSTRKLLFYFFATAFLVSAPLVVLFTAGFRISLNNQRVQQTGALAVTTSPRGATASVDGEIVSGKTPTVVQHITPNVIELKLEKKGYISWDQHVEITSGETTYVTALLYADTAPEVLETLGSTASFSPSADGRYAAYLTRKNNDATLFVYDVAARYTKSLGTYPVSANDIYNISWSGKDNFLALLKNGVALAAFTAGGDSLTIPETRDTWPILSKNITFLDNGSNIEARETVNGNNELIALLPLGTYTALEADDEYILLEDGRQTLYLISPSSSLVTTLSGKGTLYDWLSSEHTLIWSDGLEVNMYNADKKEKTFITRQSDPITSLVWHPSGQAIIIGSEKRVTAIDTVGYEKHIQTDLITETQSVLSHVWVDESGKNLYYLQKGEKEDILERRRLVK
jgi:hypothetical protein